MFFHRRRMVTLKNLTSWWKTFWKHTFLISFRIPLNWTLKMTEKLEISPIAENVLRFFCTWSSKLCLIPSFSLWYPIFHTIYKIISCINTKFRIKKIILLQVHTLNKQSNGITAEIKYWQKYGQKVGSFNSWRFLKLMSQLKTVFFTSTIQSDFI